MQLLHSVSGAGRATARVAGSQTADPTPVHHIPARINRRSAHQTLEPSSKRHTDHACAARAPKARRLTAAAVVKATAAAVSGAPPGQMTNGFHPQQRPVSNIRSHPVQLSDLSDDEPDGDTSMQFNNEPSMTATAPQTRRRFRRKPVTNQQDPGPSAKSAHRLPCQAAAAATTAIAPPRAEPAAVEHTAQTPAATAAQGRSSRPLQILLLLLCFAAATLLTSTMSSSSISQIIIASCTLWLNPSKGTSSDSSAPAEAGDQKSTPLTSSWPRYQAYTGLQLSRQVASSGTAWDRGIFPGSSSSSSSSRRQQSLRPPAALPVSPATSKIPPTLNHFSGVLRQGFRADQWGVSMHTGSSRSSSTFGSQPQAAVAAAAGQSGAAAAAAGATTAVSGTGDQSATTPGAIHMFAVIDHAAMSPYKGATWGDVINHMAKRLHWTDQRFVLNVVTQQQLQNGIESRTNLSKLLSSSSSSSSTSPMFVGIAISDPVIRDYLRSVTADLPTVLFWDSGDDLDRSSRVDGFAAAAASPVDQLLSKYVGFSRPGRSARVINTISSLWARHTSDDLLFIWLVLLNEYVTPLSLVSDTTKGMDLESLWCMISNCGSKILDCVTDETCKKGLDCLQGCAFNDQVCQYRCIVSYETPKFEQFSLCVLQLHNCRNLNARMPSMPNPKPMTSWRGQPLTNEVAESLFIGWKEAGSQMPEGALTKRYSWLISGGKSAAYDHFPCQFQLYSYGKGKGQLWYEPVFKVITLDGHEVWRRRRYRVRRGTTPGTFHYSALDNGVTSNEYWRILDCAEDLTYCLFYYSGAASVAGLSYSGAVLGTVDGVWPEAYTDRIHESLRAAGIESWELNTADNSRCADAPFY